MESKELKHQLYRFQYALLYTINRERLTPYTEANEAHVELLKRLWSTVFPTKPFAGLVGDHWKLMGFQVNTSNRTQQTIKTQRIKMNCNNNKKSQQLKQAINQKTDNQSTTTINKQ